MNQYVKQKEAQESHRILQKLLDVFWGYHQTTLIKNITGWWFGTFFVFHSVGNFIIPTDELIFFSRSTTNQIRKQKYLAFSCRCFFGFHSRGRGVGFGRGGETGDFCIELVLSWQAQR